MISRRRLIGSGMAVSALGLGSHAASAFEVFSPTAVGATRPIVSHLVVDMRFDDALEIALRFSAPGIPVIALPRDVLELWHDRLAPTPGRVRQAFAGVTTGHSLFVLRTLAADHRLRVQSTEVHSAPGRAEPLYSWVIGPAESRA